MVHSNVEYNGSYDQSSDKAKAERQHFSWLKLSRRKKASELIIKADSQFKEKSGLSLATLKKTLTAGRYDMAKNNSHIKLAVKSLMMKGTLGTLVQTTGTGASGSFKLSKKQTKAKKKLTKTAA
ncbi:hypothetical protein AOLI_G00277540 [Acnodon oligacanthus]